MYDFKDLRLAQSKTKERDDKRTDSYTNAYNDAINLFHKFNNSSNLNKVYLQQAADKLIEAMENKRSNPEPYICLSCIFFILDNNKLAVKYFKIADSLKSGLPQVNQLRTLISGASPQITNVTVKEKIIPDDAENRTEEKSTQKINLPYVGYKLSAIKMVTSLKKLT